MHAVPARLRSAVSFPSLSTTFEAVYPGQSPIDAAKAREAEASTEDERSLIVTHALIKKERLIRLESVGAFKFDQSPMPQPTCINLYHMSSIANALQQATYQISHPDYRHRPNCMCIHISCTVPMQHLALRGRRAGCRSLPFISREKPEQLGLDNKDPGLVHLV